MALNSRRPSRPYATKTDKDTAFLLGEISTGLTAMQQDISELKADAIRAGESRGRMYDKLENVGSRITSLEGTVTKLTSDVNVTAGIVSKQTTRIDKIEPIVLRAALIAGGLAALVGFTWANWDKAVALARAIGGAIFPP